MEEGDGAAPPAPASFVIRKAVSRRSRSISDGALLLSRPRRGRIGNEQRHEKQQQQACWWPPEETRAAAGERCVADNSSDEPGWGNAMAGPAMVRRKLVIVPHLNQQEMMRAATERREESGAAFNDSFSDFWGDVRSGKMAGHELGRFRRWILGGGGQIVQAVEQKSMESLSTFTNCSDFWGCFWSGTGFLTRTELKTLRSRVSGEATTAGEDEREERGWRRRSSGSQEYRFPVFASRSLQASSSERRGFLASTAATLGEVRLRRSGMGGRPSSSSEGGGSDPGGDSSLSVEELLRHPVAIVSLVPRELSLFLAGALAGAAAKTVTAPLDRVKLLMQVHGVKAAQAGIKSSIGFMEAIMKVGTEEGVKGYWKGNLPQVIRVIPYSAVQLFAYETYKKFLKGDNAELSVGRRLVAGACAGMTSTLVTYPLDTLRLRMAVDPASKTMGQVIVNMVKQEGLASFYCGLGPSLLGIAPYIALNFCVFDLVKNSLPEEVRKRPEASLVTALASATFATAICYPLDTVRRQLQMKGTPFKSVADAIPGIIARDGFLGLYRGFLPNALKNLPSSSIRLTTFDAAKNLISVSQAEYDRLLNGRLKRSDPQGGETEKSRRD